MDYFTASSLGGPDSLSLQEMLDMDVKSENDYENVFSCGGDLNFNFHELPALNLDEDSLGAPGDNNVWLASHENSLLDGDVSNSFSQDLTSGEKRMVSPNSVIPVTLIQVPYDKNAGRPTSTSATLKPLTMKIGNGLTSRTSVPIEIKKEIKPEVVDTYYSGVELKQEYESDESFDEAYVRAVAYKETQSSRTKCRSNGTVARVTNGNKRSVPIKSVQSKRRQQDSFCENDGLASLYPKPAYSYSCLIAMALKNSPSGSLPVSEIYQFMCEHFPYFKTAPNGWKNSVRHNLSLNKCFEKIEKPATNGSQRKGCLWAMNPTKMHKMDEEVQKWSKKDKTAIRRSMIYPESLDALERGELSLGGRIPMSDADSEDEEAWEQEESASWAYKQETEDDDEDHEDDEEDGEWTNERLLGTLPAPDDVEDSDISLSDFDIEVAESLYKEPDVGNFNVRVNVQTSPNGSFQPLLAGSYTVSSQGIADISPKRIKTVGGTTMTGNFVYKPVGSSTITKTKPPLRQSLLSSLEADD